MSDISEAAHAFILVADFANTDPTGKANVLGGFVSITRLDAQSGQTLPLAVVGSVAVPPRFIGQHYALELTLHGEDGQVVVPPAGTGPAVRVGQAVQVHAPNGDGQTYIPPDSLWCETKIIMNFPAGLPLRAGGVYEWRLSVDTELLYSARLLVAGAPPVTVG